MTSFAIIGTGAVGVSTCTALLHAHLSSEVTLYDLNFDKAEGEALDFAHVNSLFHGTSVCARPLEKMIRADIVILTAGVKSKLGETRLQLLERNLVAAEDIASKLEAAGLPKTLIVVTNPVDVITEYFRRRWQKKDVVVFGSGTSLDTLRLRHDLSVHFDVSPLNVHAWVVGEHGDSSVSLLSSARIGGHSIQAYSEVSGIPLPNFDKLQADVRNAAYNVIRRKGATCHAIGETTARLAKAVVHNEKVIVPVCVGIEPGVSASLPCVLGASGPRLQVYPVFSSEEKALFSKSVSILKDACSKIQIAPTKE